MNKNYKYDDLLVLKFPTEVKGYRAQVVDTVLDKVLEDYETYDQEILALKAEIDDLKALNFKLQNNLNQLNKVSKEKLDQSMDEIKTNLSSPDIIKRISSIEQAILDINEKLPKIEK